MTYFLTELDSDGNPIGERFGPYPAEEGALDAAIEKGWGIVGDVFGGRRPPADGKLRFGVISDDRN